MSQEIVFGIQHFPLFVTSGIMLNVMPGPDTLYILARSISQGRRAGVLSVMGVISGAAVHTLAAAVGVSALLAASPVAFQTLRYLGAAYLVYLGLRMLWESRTGVAEVPVLREQTDWEIFRQGFLTDLLNPKMSLFFLAFLPQFVAPSSPHKSLAMLLLGGTFLCTGTAWCMIVACSGASLSRRLRGSPGGAMWARRAVGVFFVALGLRLSLIA